MDDSIADFRLQIEELEIPPSLHPSPLWREGKSEGHLGHLNLGFIIGLLSFLLMISLTVGCQRSKAGITVAGSTSVEPFAELLAEEYMMRHPSRIYVQGGGSTAGIEAVITRAAKIGMSSRPLLGQEKNLYSVTIAKDAIAIILHPKNPINDLTLDQIREVFSGKIKHWIELKN